MEKERAIEVVLAPRLFSDSIVKKPYVVVVVDVFRATTSICAALDYGVKAIIPVKRIRFARFFKRLGYIVAAERGGKKVRFADLDNSATSFFNPIYKGKEIVYSTTNGTKAIKMAAGASEVIIGSFLNLDAVAEWIYKSNKNVIIFCAGWKNMVNMEDSLFAGALSEILMNKYEFNTDSDSVNMAVDQWNMAKSDVMTYIDRSSHRNRLRSLVDDELLNLTFNFNTSTVVPIVKNYKIVTYKENGTTNNHR
ncbi:MAG: 2-phosphosulfolactate phosphatase [Bacteroidales bacterium]|nr:2-phosphosulfolactate phosphatase [Bacteroidales bacterium]